MIDLVLHIPDYQVFLAELDSELLTKDEEDNVTGWIYDWCPKAENQKGEMLVLVRVEAEFLNTMEPLKSVIALGTYDDVLNDTELRVIYDRVYNQAPITWADEDGVKQTFNKPEKFGAFA